MILTVLVLPNQAACFQCACNASMYSCWAWPFPVVWGLIGGHHHEIAHTTKQLTLHHLIVDHVYKHCDPKLCDPDWIMPPPQLGNTVKQLARFVQSHLASKLMAQDIQGAQNMEYAAGVAPGLRHFDSNLFVPYQGYEV